MNRCPGCSYLVPPSWDSCRRCGTAVGAAAPAATQPVPATVGASAPAPAPPAPAAPAPAAPAFPPRLAAPPLTPAPPHPAQPAPPRLAPTAPAPPPLAPPAPAPEVVAHAPVPGAFDLLPGHSTAPPKPRGTEDLLPPVGSVTPEVYVEPRPPLPVNKIVAVAAVLSFAFFAWAVWPRSSGPDTSGAGDMTVLPSNDADELSMDINNVFRVQAESNLRTATVALRMAFAEIGDVSKLTAETLTRYEPSVQFVGDGEPSTAPEIVSILSGPDLAVLAVGGDSDICAFARLDPDGTLETVTVETTEACTAANPPEEGWEGAAATGGGGVPVAPGIPQIPTGPSEEELYPT